MEDSMKDMDKILNQHKTALNQSAKQLEKQKETHRKLEEQQLTLRQAQQSLAGHLQKEFDPSGLPKFLNELTSGYFDSYGDTSTIPAERWLPMWRALNSSSVTDDGSGLTAGTGRGTRASNVNGLGRRSIPQQELESQSDVPVALIKRENKPLEGLYLEVRESWGGGDDSDMMWYMEPGRPPPPCINVSVLCLNLYKGFIVHLEEVEKETQGLVRNDMLIQASQLWRLTNDYLTNPGNTRPVLPGAALALLLNTAYMYIDQHLGKHDNINQSLIILSVWQICKLLAPQHPLFQKCLDDLSHLIHHKFHFIEKLAYRIEKNDSDFLSPPQPVPNNSILRPTSALDGVNFSPRQGHTVTVVRGPGNDHFTIIDQERGAGKIKETLPAAGREWARRAYYHHHYYPSITAVHKTRVKYITSEARIDDDCPHRGGQVVIKAPDHTRNDADPSSRSYVFEVADFYEWWWKE